MDAVQQEAYRQLFATISERAGMFMPSSDRYDVVVAYLLGCDLGNTGGLLDGFAEWLLPRIGGDRNIAWWSLVLIHARPGDRPSLDDMTSEQHQQAIAVLWDLLDQFLSDCNGVLGRRKIYADYWRWQQANGMTPEV